MLQNLFGNNTVGSTAIKFLNSDRLGKDYENDLFAGDINNGNVYHFELDENRTGVQLQGPLNDTIANKYDELDSIVFAGGLNVSGITDLQVGPNGYLYVVSIGGEIYRIMPNNLNQNAVENLNKLAANKTMLSSNIVLYDTGIGLSKEGCFKYDSSASTVLVNCKSANLSYLYEVLKDPHIIGKEGSKTWILNANLEVNNGSTLYINSSDTRWLKLNSTGGHSYNIVAHGNLLIDSAKITSWDSIMNNYSRNDKGNISRSYIITKQGSGITKITNSELAYLGYNQPDSFGLTYYSGSGSVLQNNKIYDLFSGFYAKDNVHNITIDNNEIYNSTAHGVDSHSNTHNLLIKNNSIHHNEKNGVSCSIGCYSVIFESNKIYNNKGEGAMLNKNVSDSTIQNNIFSNNGNQVVIYGSSNNNTVYNNSMTGGKGGVKITANSSENLINSNDIKNSNYGISLQGGAFNNVIESNRIVNTSDSGILILNPQTNNNVFKNNILFNNQNKNVNIVDVNTSNSFFVNNSKMIP